MRLYGAALSPFVRKVRIVLAEKNILRPSESSLRSEASAQPAERPPPW